MKYNIHKSAASGHKASQICHYIIMISDSDIKYNV